MGSVFPKRTIAELEREGSILGIQDGNHGEKHPTSKDYVSQGIPFLMASNVGHGQVDTVNCKFIPRSLADSLRIGFAKPGDVLLTHKGSIGNVGIVPNGFDYVMLTPQVTYYRLNPKKLSNSFLSFAFRHPLFRDEMALVSAQSTRPYLGITAQRHLAIYHPPLPTQRKIASILSAYDDLIENNTRRITILEEMAQAIYREWFVNFRFPGHENVKLVDSPLGQIPEGWEVVSTRDAIDIKPQTKVPRQGDKPFVSMGAIPHNTMLIDESQIEMRTGNNGAKFKNGDTLFARITPCLENGKTAFVQFLPTEDDVAFGSTEFIVLRSKSVNPEFVYLLARSDEFRDIAIKSMSGATGRQRVREECFDKFCFAHATPTILEQFQEIVQPLFRSVLLLAKKNNNLRTTRDLLLPKLISGQLDVEALDIDVGEPPEELEEAAA